MPILTPRGQSAAGGPLPRRRRYITSWKEWMLFIVAGVTPLLLVAINIAAFIVNHLEQFRWTVAVGSFVSGIMLNTWWVLNIYRSVRRHWPTAGIVQPGNEEVLVIVAMFFITLFSFIFAWLCYRGLNDASKLPDPFTFVYGAIQMVILLGGKVFFDRDREWYEDRQAASRDRTAAGPRSQTLPPFPPAPPAAGPPSAGTGPQQPAGYTPPRYLPPS